VHHPARPAEHALAFAQAGRRKSEVESGRGGTRREAMKKKMQRKERSIPGMAPVLQLLCCMGVG
jgi:hypothetical protein